MTRTRAYAAYNSPDELKPFTFEYEAVKQTDVAIDVKYRGICHHCVHYTNN
jgi:D-arabinose 1-dehydrogenase-like Zn-dependent alcohol dehydrogenase